MLGAADGDAPGESEGCVAEEGVASGVGTGVPIAGVPLGVGLAVAGGATLGTEVGWAGPVHAATSARTKAAAIQRVRCSSTAKKLSPSGQSSRCSG